MTKKIKLILIAISILLGWVALTAYPLLTKKRQPKAQKEIEKNTPTQTTKKFMAATKNGDLIKSLNYITNEAKKPLTQDGTISKYEWLLTFLDVPQLPKNYEIGDITYNEKKAQITLKLKYFQGYLEKTLYLINTPPWQIDSIETLDPFWNYYDPQQNIQIKYPITWTLQHNPIEDQTSWIIKDLSGYPSITFITLNKDTSENTKQLLDCEFSDNFCETVKINDTTFTKVTNSQLSKKETLVALTTNKNFNIYMILGIIQTQNEEETALLNEVFNTIVIH